MEEPPSLVRGEEEATKTFQYGNYEDIDAPGTPEEPLSGTQNVLGAEIKGILHSKDKDGTLGGCIQEMTLGDFLEIPTSFMIQEMGDNLTAQQYCMVVCGSFLHKFLEHLIENDKIHACINTMQTSGAKSFLSMKNLPITERVDGARMIMCVPLDIVKGAAQFLRTHFLCGFQGDGIDTSLSKLSIAEKLSFDSFTLPMFKKHLEFMHMPENLQAELMLLFLEHEMAVKRVFGVLAQLTIGGQISLHESDVYSSQKRAFGKVTVPEANGEDGKDEMPEGEEVIVTPPVPIGDKLHDMFHAKLDYIVETGTSSEDAKEVIGRTIDIIKDVVKDKKTVLSECDASGKYKGVLHASLAFRMNYLIALIAEASYVSLSFCSIEDGDATVPLTLISTLTTVLEDWKEKQEK